MWKFRAWCYSSTSSRHLLHCSLELSFKNLQRDCQVLPRTWQIRTAVWHWLWKWSAWRMKLIPGLILNLYPFQGDNFLQQAQQQLDECRFRTCGIVHCIPRNHCASLVKNCPCKNCQLLMGYALTVEWCLIHIVACQCVFPAKSEHNRHPVWSVCCFS